MKYKFNLVLETLPNMALTPTIPLYLPPCLCMYAHAMFTYTENIYIPYIPMYSMYVLILYIFLTINFSLRLLDAFLTTYPYP